MYPAIVAMTLHRTGALRPGTAVGAMTSFWDLGIMVAGPIEGLIAAQFSYTVAFVVAVATAAGSFALVNGPLRRTGVSRTEQDAAAARAEASGDPVLS